MESNAFLSKEEQAPLTACQKCKDRPCIKTGKICDEVEALLPKISQGRLKRGEHSFDPKILERIMNEKLGQEYTCGGGRRKKPLQEE